MEETKLPYRNSRLFSGDFLTKRLPVLPDWEISSQELESVHARLHDLFDAAVPSTSESALEEELIRPILSDILSFSYLVQPSRRISALLYPVHGAASHPSHRFHHSEGGAGAAGEGRGKAVS